ncbi:MAG: MMPL family transporter [Planctomycetales bacterium]|nr:MMPL family transporter [Planctomycetales bacterium]
MPRLLTAQTLARILASGRSILAALLALTIPSIWVLLTSEFSPSIVESFVNSRQDYLAALEAESRYVNNPDSMLWLATVEQDLVFTPQKLSDISAAADAMRNLPPVQRVTCLPDLPGPLAVERGTGGMLRRRILNAQLKQGKVPLQAQQLDQGSIWPSDESMRPSPRQLSGIAEEVLNGGLVASRFLALNGHAQVMLIELDPAKQLSPARQVQLLSELRQIVVSHDLGSQGIHLSGLVALQGFAFEQIGIVLNSLLPVGGVLISLSVMFVFRRLEVIVFTLLVAGISICWGIGLGVVAYGKLSALMAAVPLMVLVISTADVIHLLSSYTAERTAGHAHRVAVEKMFVEVGGACVLTSLTTFVGFASLIIVPSNTIRQFGFATAAGVASALVLSVLLVPLFLEWLHRFGRPIEATQTAANITSSITHWCVGVGIRFHKLVIGSFVLVFTFACVCTYGITLDPDLTKRFSKHHPVTISTQFFNEELGGINAVELVLSGSREQLLSPNTLRQVRQFADICRAEAGATLVDSIDDLLAGFLRHLDSTNADGFPESSTHAQACLRLLQQIEPELVDSLIVEDMSEYRIIVRIQQTSYMEMLECSRNVMAIARRILPQTLRITEKGSTPLVGRAITEIIHGHLQGFILCFTTIFFLIVVGLQSLRLGWLSILPNLAPLCILGAIIAIWHRRVDSDILAVATLGLGLAVDDTIHFLSRFKIEIRAGKEYISAIEGTMAHTGAAIVRTTLILAVGFVPFAFAGYWSISMLGTYLIVVLFAALVADLILLPAILRLAYVHVPPAQRCLTERPGCE